MKKSNDNLYKTYKEIGPYLGLGFQLAATVLIFLFIGDWLDKKNNSSPLFTVIFAFLGISIGLYSVIKTIIGLEQKRKNDEKK
ncbi:MAG: hypothetical protein STSR0008_00910 [Ignavibacterium sp.]